MKRIVLAAVALGFAGGCSENPFAYQRPADALKAAFAPFAPAPCSSNVQEAGQIAYMEIRPDRECYRFRPSERLRGVWYIAQEESAFIADASQPLRASHDTWLNGDELMIDRLYRSGAPDTDFAFKVDFIGRRAAFPGRYGHMGAYRI